MGGNNIREREERGINNCKKDIEKRIFLSSYNLFICLFGLKKKKIRIPSKFEFVFSSLQSLLLQLG